jgi:large subunit ribosomal protein L13
MITYQPKAKEIVRGWHLVDAKGRVLGRLATQIAGFLIGKGKPNFSRHMDSGDYVVVLNAEKVILTGKKEEQKVYYSHSGYPAGLKHITAGKLRQEHPERLIEKAVKGMLPDNRLKDKRLSRFKVVIGEKNPYQEKFTHAKKD